MTTTRVLVINGSVGAGKTTVAEAVTDLLRARGVPYGWVDVDALRRVYPTGSDDPFAHEVALDHLTAMAPVFDRRGYHHVVLSDVVERRADRDRYATAFGGAQVVVVRLTASEATRVARLRAREPEGWLLDWHLRRTVELERILDEAGADDAVVVNEGRPPERTAVDVLAAAGW